jgi:hypothetical protein
MHDVAAWRSEIRLEQAPATMIRFTGRFGDAGKYSDLPARLEAKIVAPADPLPPGRTPTDFYGAPIAVEYLSRPNEIIADSKGESLLDTLFAASGTTLAPPARAVVMTRTHGKAGAVIFSGFSLWSFKRAQLGSLVDFVLREMWGLKRAPSAAPLSRSGPAPARARTASPPRR